MSTGKSERTVAASGRKAESDVQGDGPMSDEAIERRAYELYLARGPRGRKCDRRLAPSRTRCTARHLKA
jgi:hypothetical protein